MYEVRTDTYRQGSGSNTAISLSSRVRLDYKTDVDPYHFAFTYITENIIHFISSFCLPYCTITFVLGAV
jgi:hypothetical protein